MEREKLLDLIAVLESVPRDRFDMNRWWCGTVGCAAGHYVAARPSCGLKFQPLNPEWSTPVCKATGHTGYAALQREFRLGIGHVNYVFNPIEYDDMAAVTPAMVIDRVRDLLARD